MGLELSFHKYGDIAGYGVSQVKGVEAGGEYGVLEIPSSYCGLPVIGIDEIDSTPAWMYQNNARKRPHFKHIIFPGTLGYIGKGVQIGRVDKLTLRGFSPRAGWMPSGYASLFQSGRQIHTFTANDIVATGIGSYLDADTVVFEGEEIPPRLFSSAGDRTVKIKRFVAPNAKIVGEDAFCGCDVSEFELPYGLKAIGRGAFFNCKLKNIKIPSTVTYIGPYAFRPDRVDRASLRVRAWEFEVPPRHEDTKSAPWFYCQNPLKRAKMCSPDLWKRHDELRYRIEEWLNAADPNAPTKYRNRYAPYYKRFDFFGGVDHEVRCCDGFWFSFKEYALVCGADPKPKGLWYNTNTPEPYYI